jgi:type VI protein secretion system component Hcp
MNLTRIVAVVATTIGALALAAPAKADKNSSIALTIGDQTSAINSYNWGASNPATHTGGGGGGAGKVNFSDFNVSKDTDAMTPTLVRDVATGEHLPQIAVAFTQGAFTTSYCLQDVIVTSVQNGASTGQARPSDSVAFNFSRFTIRVGSAAFAFDILQNAPDPASC